MAIPDNLILYHDIKANIEMRLKQSFSSFSWCMYYVVCNSWEKNVGDKYFFYKQKKIMFIGSLQWLYEYHLILRMFLPYFYYGVAFFIDFLYQINKELNDCCIFYLMGHIKICIIRPTKQTRTKM